MSNQDALTRLEKWLDDEERVLRGMEKAGDTYCVMLENWASDDFANGEGPDLSTAIHAALDRAEEAGL